MFVRWLTKWRASALGLYPSRSIASSTRLRVAADTSAAPRTTLETVDLETPAAAATSRIVGAFSMRWVTGLSGLMRAPPCCSPSCPLLLVHHRSGPPADHSFG